MVIDDQLTTQPEQLGAEMSLQTHTEGHGVTRARINELVQKPEGFLARCKGVLDPLSRVTPGRAAHLRSRSS